MPLEAHLILWFSVALAALGLGSLAVAFWSLSWTLTKGRVEVSFLDKEAAWSAESGSEVVTNYKKDNESHAFAYSYEIDGTKYINHRRKPWGEFDWKFTSGGDADGFHEGRTLWSGARDAAKWYREGATVDVYYCPLNPKWACLEPGGFLLPLVLLFVAGVIFKVGAAL